MPGALMEGVWHYEAYSGRGLLCQDMKALTLELILEG